MVTAIFTPDKSELPMRQHAIEGMEWVGKRCANKITGASNALDESCGMDYSNSVRCGSPTAVCRQRPRVFSGAVWSQAYTPLSDCPAKGPAPLSTWGFSLVSRFCGAWVGALEFVCSKRRSGGLQTGTASACTLTTKPIPDPQGGLAVGCFDGSRDGGGLMTRSAVKVWGSLPRMRSVDSPRLPPKHPLGLNGLHPRNRREDLPGGGRPTSTVLA